MSKIIDAIKETLLPSIPHLSEDDAKDPRLVAQAVEALKEILEVRLGQRGDKLDQSPTWRDLYNNGTIDVIIKGAVLSNAGTNTELPTTGTVNNSVVPPAPTGLSVNAAYTDINISWDAPSYSNHNYTEIWRCDSDDIGQASFLGTATSQVYSDSVGYAETKYYWIRFVSKSDIVGVYNATSGTSGTTAANVAAVLTSLNETITHSSLATTLLATINTTFTQTSAPTAKPDGRSLVAGDTWYDSNDKNKLYRYNGSSWADVRDTDIAQAISDAGTAQSTADGKVEFYYQSTAPTGLVAADVGDLWIDTGDDNKLHRWQDVSGTYGWADIQDTGIGTAISAASTAQSTADGKITTFYQAAQPTAQSTGDFWVDTDDGDKIYRYSGSSWAALALANEAYVGTEITEQVGYCEFTATSGGVKNIATAYTNKTACEAATSGTGTYAWKDEPFAALDNMVSTTAGGLVASAQESMTSVAGLEAQYSVKLDSNGYVAGFGLSSTTSSDTTNGNFSEFNVNADRFAIVHPSNNGVTSPFVVDGSNVYMEAAFIKDASITQAKIGTLNANAITATSLSSFTANLGTVTAGKMQNADASFVVDMTNKTIYIQ